tara:strand:- start:29 stop:598 length:570 start_codon:yes stop_codon:yes gene_type:complete
MDVWCAIRTYPKHAQELGNSIPQEPVFFLKPESSIISFSQIDTSSDDIHHEIELVLKLGSDGNPEQMALGLDLTKRKIQSKIKEQGLPWSEAKAFTGSAIIGNWHTYNQNASFTLTINGVIKQQGALSKMNWTPHQLIQKLSNWASIREGDLLFTGTPEGVGKLSRGDTLTATLYNDNQIIDEQKANCI